MMKDSTSRFALFASIGVFLIVIIAVLVPISFAAGTTVTVQTNAKFSAPAAGGTSIPVNGTVTPAPGVAGYSVTVQLTNPSGLLVVQSASVNQTTGFYKTTFVSGTPAQLWGNGTYTVTAVYGTSAQGPTTTASTTFAYGTFVTTSTSSTSSTSSTGSTGSTGSVSGGHTTTTTSTTVDTTATVTSVTTTTVPGTTVTHVTTLSGTVLTQVTTLGGTTIVTTITHSSSVTNNNSTAEALGAVAIIIAIVAGALAAMALRKK
jgi:hypothetical protein